MFSVTHRDPLFCPHSPYFVSYGVQKRRLRLVTINRTRPCSFYDLGICWQLSVWKSCWASKQEVDRLITRLGTYWQTAKLHTWPTSSIMPSTGLLDPCRVHHTYTHIILLTKSEHLHVMQSQMLTSHKYHHHLSRTTLFSKSNHTSHA